MTYWALLAVGAGAWFGATITMPLPPHVIRRNYGAFLALVAARMLVMGK